MTTFTYSQARQHFSSVLELATKEGEVKIIRRDGKTYQLRPETKVTTSPLDIKGIKLHLTADEIVKTIREQRKR